LPAGGAVSVTFTMTHAGLVGRRLAVVGDFNNWDPGANPMEHHDGAYTTTVALDPGRYRFRYLSEDGAWFNDEAADAYEDNDHGGHDSVLDITDVPGHTAAGGHIEQSGDSPADPAVTEFGAAGSPAPSPDPSRAPAEAPPGLPGLTDPAEPDLPARRARAGRRRAQAPAVDPGGTR